MSAAPVPNSASLNVLADAARGCTACDLFRNATQTVFGEGRKHALIAAVGEQPGDYEDREGRPFVGPAGKLLSRAFEAAGVDRGDVYLTNAVKHFKFEPRGKRRIHQTPNSGEIRACHPWLEAEMRAVKPQLIIALGATALHALLSKKVPITPLRGQFIPHSWAPSLFVTLHPSAILRAALEDRDREYARFVEDLKLVAGWLRHHRTAA